MQFHVLLVDDHRFVATVLDSMLATVPDVTLHWCERASDALAKANALRPALILQDLVMPEMDGLTLLRQYRENAATGTTPVIVLSGNDDAQTRARASAAGADAYMVKLPTKDALVSAIQRLTQQPPSLTPPASAASAAFMDALFAQFVTEATARIAALRDAAERRDPDTMRRTAHNLKGSSSIVGAQRLAALCAEIEDGLTSAAHEVPTTPVIARIDAELARVREAFASGRGGVK